MSGKIEIAAAIGVAFGVVLGRVLPKGWALWKEVVAVGAVCIAVHGVLKILGHRLPGEGYRK